MFLRTALLVLKKDVAIEVRSLEIISTTLFFAISCVLIFSFALVGDDGQAIDKAMVPAAILWIAVAFAGVLGLGRTFERERYGETLRALLLAPTPRSAIYVGKLLGVVLLLTATEVVLVPLIAFVFHAALFDHILVLSGLLLAGSIGFAVMGTLFAAMLVRSRSREIMLPVILYPFTIPALIAGVRGTAAVLTVPSSVPTATMWLGVLTSYDIVFLTIALWAFESVMTE